MKPTTERLPESVYTISVKRCVLADHLHSFVKGLRDEKPVKWIAVMKREGSPADKCDRFASARFQVQFDVYRYVGAKIVVGPFPQRIGSARRRVDFSVMVTTAPLSRNSSIRGHSRNKSLAKASAFKPSIRIRMVDGADAS
jgi:hypothetical protein